MADIELVIKMSEEKYKWIKENNPKADKNSIVGAIVRGIPLSKGHGRLIDADVLVDGMEDDYEFCEATNATPTIIEADKEQTNEQR